MGPFICALAERLSSGGAQRKPKVAKGARDFLPEQVRSKFFGACDSVRCTGHRVMQRVCSTSYLEQAVRREPRVVQGYIAVLSPVKKRLARLLLPICCSLVDPTTQLEYTLARLALPICSKKLVWIQAWSIFFVLVQETNRL